MTPNRTFPQNILDNAFDAWSRYIKTAKWDAQARHALSRELFTLFPLVIRECDLQSIFLTGRQHGFAPVSVVNIIILHGGYHRLLESGFLSVGHTRFIDSLYQPTFPELDYNTANSSILAPWITLPAQEALLDISLQDALVVEYGSGASTFFFKQYAARVISFEDDSDPAGGASWTNLMKQRAKQLSVDIDLIRPDNDNVMPSYILSNLWSRTGKILVMIDGLNRYKHFSDWAESICADQSLPIVLLVDNSEIGSFRSIFAKLIQAGSTVTHYYGNVYGQLTTKQCTSFVTFAPKLLHSRVSAPADHDLRWGKMNFQE